jgi:hypothetical protein
MMHKWIRDLFVRKTRTVRKAQKPARPRFVRPSLQILEDRTAPAVFTVTSTADDGGANELR